MAKFTIQVDKDLVDAAPGADVATPDSPPQKTVTLNARKTIAGDFVIFDHRDIDIVLSPEQKKIILFPKDSMADRVYDAQNRLFHHLNTAGIIERDSIQGGNVYGTLEAKLQLSPDEKLNPMNAAIYSISRHLDEEEQYYSVPKDHEEEERDQLLNPDAEDSTELGEVPHEDQKGSITPGLRPYGLMYRIWENKE